MIRVFKFGGISIANAENIRNITQIIVDELTKGPLFVVFSAMGKTTNLLEDIWHSAKSKDSASYENNCSKFYAYHRAIIDDLLSENEEAIADLDRIFNYLVGYFGKFDFSNPDLSYDQIIPAGELLSSKIIAAYFKSLDLNFAWKDARSLIGTDSNFRRAKVDFDISCRNVKNQISFEEVPLIITQGFIGSEKNNFITTLGREGSDYSAAIFAHCLNAKELVIWKDVPGILNADPKIFPNTIKIDNLSYQEAMELSYFGAKVIHPNTLRPLQVKQIPLFVKPFQNPQEKGSVIGEFEGESRSVPSLILQQNQCLVSLSNADFSYIPQSDLSKIFEIFSRHNAQISIVQNSALNFTASFSIEEYKFEDFIVSLSKQFIVKYNKGLELLTIRNYIEGELQKYTQNREVLLTQKSRNTIRILMRKSF